MNEPVQKFLVGERVVWRTPAVDAQERCNLFARATVINCFCKFARSPALAQLVYTLLLESKVWHQNEWRARSCDIYRRMPKGGKLWTRALALKKKPK